MRRGPAKPKKAAKNYLPTERPEGLTSEYYRDLFYQVLSDVERANEFMRSSQFLNAMFHDVILTYPIIYLMQQQSLPVELRQVNVRVNIEEHNRLLQEGSASALPFDLRYREFNQLCVDINPALSQFLDSLPAEAQILIGTVFWSLQAEMTDNLSKNINARLMSLQKQSETARKNNDLVLHGELGSEMDWVTINESLNVKYEVEPLAHEVIKLLESDKVMLAIENFMESCPQMKIYADWISKLELMDVHQDVAKEQQRQDYLTKLKAMRMTELQEIDVNDLHEREKCYERMSQVCSRLYAMLMPQEEEQLEEQGQRLLRAFLRMTDLGEDGFMAAPSVGIDNDNNRAATLEDVIGEINPAFRFVNEYAQPLPQNEESDEEGLLIEDAEPVMSPATKIVWLTQILLPLLRGEQFRELISNPELIERLQRFASAEKTWSKHAGGVEARQSLQLMLTILTNVRAKTLFSQNKWGVSYKQITLHDAIEIFNIRVSDMQNRIDGMRAAAQPYDKEIEKILGEIIRQSEHARASMDNNDSIKLVMLELAGQIEMLQLLSSKKDDIAWLNQKFSDAFRHMSVELAAKVTLLLQQKVDVNSLPMVEKLLKELNESQSKFIFADKRIEAGFICDVLRIMKHSEKLPPVVIKEKIIELLKEMDNYPDGMRLNLCGRNLSSANFTGINRSCVNFNEANFSKAIFTNCAWRECILTACKLQGADFNHVKFESCNLQGVDLTNAQLDNVSFAGCALENAILIGIHCDNVSFAGASMDGAQLIQFEHRMTDSEWDAAFSMWVKAGIPHEVMEFNIMNHIAGVKNYSHDEQMAIREKLNSFELSVAPEKRKLSYDALSMFSHADEKKTDKRDPEPDKRSENNP